MLAALALTAATLVPPPAVAEDVALLERVLRELHPGLERYPEVDLDRSLAALRAQVSGERSRAEVYLALLRFTASLRCSHTYPNPNNQSKAVRAELLDGRNRVPFSFRIVEGRMVVVDSATDDPRLVRGSEIVALDGRAAREVLHALFPLARGDGANDHKRWSDLEVRGSGGYETFDVGYALQFRPGPTFRVEVRPPGAAAAFTAELPAVTREERQERLARVRPADPRAWSRRRLDERTLLLRLGTFATWSMEGDWRQKLDALFEGVTATAPATLVLDVQGNEGGNDEVVEALVSRLFPRPVETAVPQERVRYRQVPPDLGRHLKSWSDDFRDLSAAARPLDARWLERRAGGTVTLPHRPDAFGGRVVLLVDSANSSATFRLADLLSRTRRATLVGQPTGGNRRGTNGGLVAFLTLPGSGIEIDVPLVGYFPSGDPRDEGIVPDLVVPAGTPAEDALRQLGP